jgi:hypothetical protein
MYSRNSLLKSLGQDYSFLNDDDLEKVLNLKLKQFRFNFTISISKLSTTVLTLMSHARDLALYHYYTIVTGNEYDNIEEARDDVACFDYDSCVNALLKFKGLKGDEIKFDHNNLVDGIYSLELDLKVESHAMIMVVEGEKIVVASMYNRVDYYVYHTKQSIIDIFQEKDIEVLFKKFTGITGMYKNYQLGDIDCLFYKLVDITTDDVISYYENVILPNFKDDKTEVLNKIQLLKLL